MKFSNIIITSIAQIDKPLIKKKKKLALHKTVWSYLQPEEKPTQQSQAIGIAGFFNLFGKICSQINKINCCYSSTTEYKPD